VRITRLRALVVALALVIGAPALGFAQPLPPDVVPDQYELRLALNFHDDTFTGSEQILVTIVKPTARVTLNAVGISFKQVTIASGFSSQPATVAVDERHDTATFSVRRRLVAGPARIRIEYTARLQAGLRGLYVGRANGRKYAATQFEATEARRAFPCFDQPDMKASFLLTAVVPAGDVAISNGRVLSDTPGPGPDEHTVKFATTRKMSTYLMALSAGDFRCLEAQSDGVPIRVCAIAGKEALGRFALDAAQAFLRFYDQYFTVKYPFGKLDLIAIPDFESGGMENTAAIFFGEHDLLVDPQGASIESRKLVASTIAHEMAHQWIGDLVTMKWWNDLWLKEGFATFMETKPIRAWKPEWHVELDEVASAEDGMASDGLASAHPARTTVTTPAEIDESYDAIVYQKAGAVFRMVEAAMGPEPFRVAVNGFIRQFAYANAGAEDLWAALDDNTVRATGQILRTFLEQPGVPVVSIAARCVTDATSSLALAQQRFWIDSTRAAATSPVWAIPVSTRPVAPPPGVPAASSNHLLSAKEQAFDLAGCNALVLGNAEAAGYFRSAYAPEMLARLAQDAETHLTPAERLRLLDDQWALARAGRLDVGEYLSLVGGYSTERYARIIERMGETLRVVDDRLAVGADRDAYHGWVRRLLAPLAAGLDQPSTDDNEVARRGLRATLLYFLGAVGRDPDVLGKARALVMDGDANSAGDAAMLAVFLRLAAASGDGAVLDRLAANIEHASSPDVYLRNVSALGDFGDPALVERALGYAISEHVHGQDAADAIAAALENTAARPAAWAFVKAHWNDIAAKSGADQAAEHVLMAATGFCDADMRDDVKAFFGGKRMGGSHALAQTLEQIQGCIDFKATQQTNFARWLAKQSGPTPPGSPPRSIATAGRRRP
jgi:aminopeptidase N